MQSRMNNYDVQFMKCCGNPPVRGQNLGKFGHAALQTLMLLRRQWPPRVEGDRTRGEDRTRGGDHTSGRGLHANKGTARVEGDCTCGRGLHA